MCEPCAKDSGFRTAAIYCSNTLVHASASALSTTSSLMRPCRGASVRLGATPARGAARGRAQPIRADPACDTYELVAQGAADQRARDCHDDPWAVLTQELRLEAAAFTCARAQVTRLCERLLKTGRAGRRLRAADRALPPHVDGQDGRVAADRRRPRRPRASGDPSSSQSARADATETPQRSPVGARRGARSRKIVCPSPRRHPT